MRIGIGFAIVVATLAVIAAGVAIRSGAEPSPPAGVSSVAMASAVVIGLAGLVLGIVAMPRIIHRAAAERERSLRGRGIDLAVTAYRWSAVGNIPALPLMSSETDGVTLSAGSAGVDVWSRSGDGEPSGHISWDEVSSIEEAFGEQGRIVGLRLVTDRGLVDFWLRAPGSSVRGTIRSSQLDHLMARLEILRAAT
jgi:hypothetical protein